MTSTIVEVAIRVTVLDVTDAVLGCNSEVGTLRAVILHRPGPELQRLTPRNNDTLLFDGLPWVARAQEEHDAFAALLRSRGVEVLLLGGLLTEALAHSGAARMHGIAAAVDSRRLGLPLAQELSAYLRTLEAGALSHVLMAGMTFDELPFGENELSLVRRMHHGGDFVIDPLPLMKSRSRASVPLGGNWRLTPPGNSRFTKPLVAAAPGSVMCRPDSGTRECPKKLAIAQTASAAIAAGSAHVQAVRCFSAVATRAAATGAREGIVAATSCAVAPTDG